MEGLPNTRPQCPHSPCERRTWWGLEADGCFPAQGDEDHLFDKDTVNLWAEPLLLVKHLNAHLVQLLTDAPLPLCDPEQLQALHSRAQAQCHLLSQRLGRLPPNAAFLRTPEFTQLRITEERTQACLRLLAQLG